MVLHNNRPCIESLRCKAFQRLWSAPRRPSWPPCPRARWFRLERNTSPRLVERQPPLSHGRSWGVRAAWPSIRVRRSGRDQRSGDHRIDPHLTSNHQRGETV